MLCVLLFLFQEKLIFFPEKLNKDFQFDFNGKFEEIKIRTRDHKYLNSVLFKSDSARGIIFYLHGNAGSIQSWGDVATAYTNLNYDVFLVDYRGYGKSEGSISSQEEFFDDLQLAYDEIKARYNEERIIILGYSIGTGPATRIAATNKPQLLILQAPYFSLTDMMRRRFPVVPTAILKYKFRTDQFIRDCKMPIIIFHGDRDEVIYYGSSLKLKELLKESDTLITLRGQGHNGITDNPEYKTEIEKILSDHHAKTSQENSQKE